MNSLMSLEAQHEVRLEFAKSNLFLFQQISLMHHVCFSFQAVDVESFHTRGYQILQKHSHWLQRLV